ncbi:hypothetical protein [Methylobacterium platani]|uniref:Lipoprotein n=2 Tax=Methylobacterium platani TaxID=427683 RepID=A0A179SE90_9HYPH|nr:hypothetical protein [Methylobacterium platani]KMO13464.1 hypothetical protein SQ03_21820 [Methylobacterium platani JCM 14648]OAS25746.1 hypothetical protein A5481_07860 [Methylobacterium platani]
MSVLSRACLVVAVAALAGGCINNPLGQVGGVLPAGDVGPPPSLRGDVKLPARSNGDLAQAATEPTRRLNVPSSTRGSDTLSAAPRRIRRDEIEGEGGPSGSGGSSLSPSIGSGGSVGLGGKF